MGIQLIVLLRYVEQIINYTIIVIDPVNVSLLPQIYPPSPTPLLAGTKNFGILPSEIYTRDIAYITVMQLVLFMPKFYDSHVLPMLFQQM